TALREKRFDEAVESYQAAVRLFPAEKEAQDALQKAKQAKAEARTDYDRYMAQGNMALQAQRLYHPLRPHTPASQLFPTANPALRALQNAQALLANAQANAQAGQAAYLNAMTQGALAMQNLRYADAVTAYTQALQLVPNDPAALQGLRDAQLALNRLG